MKKGSLSFINFPEASTCVPYTAADFLVSTAGLATSGAFGAAFSAAPALTLPSYLFLNTPKALKSASAICSRPFSDLRTVRSVGLARKPIYTRTDGIAVFQRTQNGSCHIPRLLRIGPADSALSTSSAKSRLCSRWAICMRLKKMNDSGSEGSKP